MRRMIVIAPGVLLALATAGCGSPVRATSDFSLSHPWAAYKRMEVQVRNGGVELRSGNVTQIKITGRKYASGRTMEEAQANLEKVTIQAAAHPDQPDTFRVALSYPDELRSNSVGADVVIEVPEPCSAQVRTSNGAIRVKHLANNVELVTSNGGVRVTDVQGPVKAETSNGRVDVENVSGHLSASSSNGSITARNVQGGCDLETSNGDISADQVQGDVEARTSNGGIRALVVPPAGGRVELRSSNGGIRLTLPEELAAELKLSATNGRVQTSLGKAVLTQVAADKRHYRAIMNGGGATVVAETSNGSITVETR